jgi:Mg2+ and Co2+ transporter CorA
MVDITQDGNNSSRNSGPTSNLNTQAHRLQNVVIDIESEDLTFNQARAIRQQIQKDVEQLQNRVRMLQQEEQRAMKKIAETRKKTQSIRDLQEKNDEKFKMMLIE